MTLRTMLAFLTAAALAATPAVASAAPPRPHPRPAVPGEATADTLTIFSDYHDHAVVEVVDLATGDREVVVERGHPRDADGGADSPVREHPGAEGGSVGGASTSARCSNGGTWNYVNWSSGGRTRRPWRMSDAISFNPAGAPVTFNWRAEMLAASDIWQNTVDACGLADQIGWVTPAVGPDTTAVPCAAAFGDGINAHGWVDFGGWGDHGLLLGRTCLYSSSTLGTIVEADIAYNRHPAAVWCNGACTSGYDLRSLAAHEWGHYLGLGHVCNDGDLGNPCNTAGEEGAVMYPWIAANETKNRTLSLGDVQGAAALYPHEWGYEVVDVAIDNPAGADQPLTPGRTYDATATVRNTGLRHWPVGGPVRLRTADGTASAYADGSWLDAATASLVDADLTDDFHHKLPNDETVVITDEEAAFSFTVTVPFSKEPASGTLADAQAFRLAGPAFTTSGTGALDLPVGSIALEVVSQAGPGHPVGGVPGVVVQGLQTDASLTVGNTGTAPWFPADGTMRLVTDPAGHCSPFRGADWVTCEVVSPLDATSIVRAGEEGRFAFQMSSPVGAEFLGPQHERFALEWMGRPVPRLQPGATFPFVVL